MNTRIESNPLRPCICGGKLPSFHGSQKVTKVVWLVDVFAIFSIIVIIFDTVLWDIDAIWALMMQNISLISSVCYIGDPFLWYGIEQICLLFIPYRFMFLGLLPWVIISCRATNPSSNELSVERLFLLWSKWAFLSHSQFFHTDNLYTL